MYCEPKIRRFTTIDWSRTEQSMMMYVAEIGQVERGRQCHLMLDHQNKRKKSFALLYYILHARDQYNPSSAMMENAKNHGRTKNKIV